MKQNNEYKRINIIIPYFGKFPNYFPLYLQSCKYNPTIDWTIITDNKDNYLYPQNVNKIEISFEELVKKIQSYFGFKIALNKPYKLCDFKPAYGYLFKDIVEKYDYWGFGDLDVIYGDIRSFLTDDILLSPKVFSLGHLSLIKNEKKYNELFMSDILQKDYYKLVFSDDKSYNFDEAFFDNININTIFRADNNYIFESINIADIYTKSTFFRLTNKYNTEKIKNAFFLWNNGKLYRYVKKSNGIYREEYIYIHLQKRKMKVKNVNLNMYKIIPNSFCDLEVDNEAEIFNSFKYIKKFEMNSHYLQLRVKNLKVKIKHKFRKR